MKTTIHIPELDFTINSYDVNVKQYTPVKTMIQVGSLAVMHVKNGLPITLITCNMPLALQKEIDGLVATYCN